LKECNSASPFRSAKNDDHLEGLRLQYSLLSESDISEDAEHQIIDKSLEGISPLLCKDKRASNGSTFKDRYHTFGGLNIKSPLAVKEASV